MYFARIFVAVLATVAVVCSAADYLQEFKGKNILVTGGSSGIGYQVALEFAQYGANVVIAARDDHPTWFTGAQAVTNIMADARVQANGGKARFVKTDMSHVDEVKALFADIKGTEKNLHFAVNAAGIGGPLGPLYTVADFINGSHCPVRNNIYGTIFSLMYETRLMIENNQTGAIVNFASTNGLKSTPNGALYGTSKFGIVGLTRSVAATFANPAEADDSIPFIRVNAVAPSLTDTSLTWQQAKFKEDGTQPFDGPYITPESDLWKKWGPAMINKSVSKALATPKNMADAALFLCSSDAAYITGHILSVDRGSLA